MKNCSLCNDEIIAAALKEVVRLCFDDKHNVAWLDARLKMINCELERHTSALANLLIALAVEDDLLILSHPWRNIDFENFLLFDRFAAVTPSAFVLLVYNCTLAVALIAAALHLLNHAGADLSREQNASLAATTRTRRNGAIFATAAINKTKIVRV